MITIFMMIECRGRIWVTSDYNSDNYNKRMYRDGENKIKMLIVLFRHWSYSMGE